MPRMIFRIGRDVMRKDHCVMFAVMSWLLPVFGCSKTAGPAIDAADGGSVNDAAKGDASTVPVVDDSKLAESCDGGAPCAEQDDICVDFHLLSADDGGLTSGR